MTNPTEPEWVTLILDWKWTWVLARIGLTCAYWVGGISKLSNFSGAIAEQQRFGLHPAWLWAGLAITVELTGSLLVISGRYVWLGAGALGVLTCIAAVTANNFWAMEGHERIVAFNAFLKLIGLISGFVLVAMLAYEIERRQGTPDT